MTRACVIMFLAIALAESIYIRKDSRTPYGFIGPSSLRSKSQAISSDPGPPISTAQNIAVLNFKCYLNNAGYERILNGIESLDIPKNVKLLISAPNIYLHKFTKLANFNEKYELCAQHIGLPSGFGPYTGEITAEMLKDVGVRWCLVGHKEISSKEQTYKDNVTRLMNAMNAKITPILILSGDESDKVERSTSGYSEFDAENEANTLITKLERYIELLKGNYKKLILGYEPRMSVGTGVPMDPIIARSVKERIDIWTKNLIHKDIRIDVLYGGSLSATNTREYLMAGFSGLLFGKICTNVDMQTIINSFSY